jgi:hypothetical protein
MHGSGGALRSHTARGSGRPVLSKTVIGAAGPNDHKYREQVAPKRKPRRRGGALEYGRGRCSEAVNTP